MERTILVVDDNPTERVILNGFLNKEYSIIEAANGDAVLTVLSKKYRTISAIVMDLIMPGMNGFETLQRIKENPLWLPIPVIIATGLDDEESREKAIEYGADNFVTKPFNQTLLSHIVRNAIKLHEASAIASTLWRDILTGLLNKESFYTEASRIVRNSPNETYFLSAFNIDNFKVINDQYGTKVGDKVLMHIAKQLNRFAAVCNGISCRIMADKFAVLFPKEIIETDVVKECHNKMIKTNFLSRPIRIRVGRYLVTDRSMPLSAMYDRASLAEASIKGRIDVFQADYDESMREKLLREQRIVNDMEEALENEEFEIWFQPQFNHATGAMIGSEALVRWRKDGKIISPNEFIPVFERNGFIYEVDRYVWRRVCEYLRDSINRGKKPLPVSVNISRYDVFQNDFYDTICGLVKEFRLPTDLLRLEITESAFSESTNIITSMVNKLIRAGFTVEIDDFGSGYSSLNTLKDVAATILKLDIRFFEATENSQRGGNIVESVIRMAKWLGMAVIAEGVETMEQADYLKSIGCFYIQGFLYERPMPLPDLEALQEKGNKEQKLTRLKTLETLDNNEFWDPNSMDTLIFNSYVGAACIAEYVNGKVEIIRLNDSFIKLLNIKATDIKQIMGIDWSEYLDEENKHRFQQAILSSMQNKTMVGGEYEFLNLPRSTERLILHTGVRVIATVGGRYLVYCLSENITAQRKAEYLQREAEKKQSESAHKLEVIMSNINGGVSAILINDDATSQFVFSNDRYFELYGYTKEEAEKNALDPLTLILPEDLKNVMEKVRALKKNRKPMIIDYRIVKKDGQMAMLRANSSLMSIEGYGDEVITSVLTDISEKKSLEEKLRAVIDNINGGVSAVYLKKDKPEYIIANEQYYRIIGYTREQFKKEVNNIFDLVCEKDRERIQKEFIESRQINGGYSMEYQITQRDGSVRDILCNTSVIHLFGIDEPVQLAVSNDITELREAQRKELAAVEKLKQAQLELQKTDIHNMLPMALSTMMSSSTDYAYVMDKDLYYVCCSQNMASLLGLKEEKEVYGKTDADLFGGELGEFFGLNHKKVAETGVPLINQMEEIPQKNGKTIFVSSSIYPVKNFDGGIIGLYGVSHDISSEFSLHFELNTLLNVIPSGVLKYSADAKEEFAYVNRNFIEELGYTKESFAEKFHNCFREMIWHEDRKRAEDEVKRQEGNGRIGRFEYRVEAADGRLHWIHDEGIKITDNSGKSWYYVSLFDITEQHEAQEKLRVSEEINRLAIGLSGKIVTQFNVEERTLTLPEFFTPIYEVPRVLYGMPEEQIKLGRVSQETADDYRKMFYDIINGSKSGTIVYQQRSILGFRWLEASYTTVTSENGRPVFAVITFEDITDRLDKEVVYNKWQQSLEDRTQDSFTLLRCNLSKNTSFDSSEGSLIDFESVCSQNNLNDLNLAYANQIVAEDRDAYLTFLDSDVMLASYFRGHRSDKMEYREKRKDGSFRWILLSKELVEYPNSKEIEAYLMYEDIDAQKSAELKTKELAETDPLTGILNRTTFASKLDEMLKHPSKNTYHAFLMLDLDSFKSVNDTFGHEEGDKVLLRVTEYIRSQLRKDDLFGRMGGDEFFIFLTNVPSREVVERKADRICKMNIMAGNGEGNITVSIGISLTPLDGQSFEELFKKADIALYKQKKAGKNGYQFFM